MKFFVQVGLALAVAVGLGTAPGLTQTLVPVAKTTSKGEPRYAAPTADGRLPVLVNFDVSMPEPAAGDAAVKKARETAIRATQLSLLASLSAELAESAQGLAAADNRIDRLYDQLPIMSLNLSTAEIARLEADPRVRMVERVTLDEAYLSTSVGLIGANTLFASGITGSGQRVVIFDSGTDHDHSFLSSKINGSVCFSRTAGSGTSASLTFCPNGLSVDTTSPKAGDDCAAVATPAGSSAPNYDGCDHGTHVGGIAAGSGGQSFTGVARDAQILAAQVFSGFPNDEDGPTVLSYSSDRVAAHNHILSLVQGGAQNIASINMSLGGGTNTSFCNGTSEAVAVQNLRAAGVLTVIATGNDGFQDAIGSPACIEAAISVGSTTKTDGMSSFSNSSPLTDVVAPGSSINSSIVTASATNLFASFNGTSMATPHVAGAVALLRSRTPRPTPDEIEQALRFTGTMILDIDAGWRLPRINLVEANNYLTGPLRVTPMAVMNFRPTGPTGTSPLAYTLTNTTGTAQAFSVSSSVGWLTASPSSGSVPANGTVQVTLTADASHASATTGRQTAVATITYGSRSVRIPAHMALPQPPPANDNFADAVTMTGASGTLTGSNVSATGESGEPASSAVGTLNSVWWKWTATGTGSTTIDTFGSNFDTVMSVFTGSAVNALTLVGENDDSPSNLQSTLTFDATAGTTYMVRVDGFSGGTGAITLNWSGPAGTLSAPVAAILPQARAVAVNATANAFATIVNPHAQQLTNCRIEMPASGAPAGTFSYQTTNSSNALTGTVNTPANIPANGSQSFVFGFQPTANFAATTMAMRFRCDNANEVVSINGVNTFTLTSSFGATPDMVALAASATPGSVTIPASGSPPTGAFAVATVNVGVSGTVFVTADTNGVSLPISVFMCQTNPATGACTSAIANVASTIVAANATPTYAIFVQGTGGTIANDPATNRVFIRFRTGSLTGPIVGATSVAVVKPS